MTGSGEPPPDRETFELPLAIVPADIDENGHVNNVVYVRWLQEAGVAHWRKHFSAEESAHYAWVVIRHEIDYRRELKLGDPVKAVTWVGTPRGARFDRHVRIEGPKGVCAQGRSEWVMIDVASGRPARIPPEISEPFLKS